MILIERKVNIEKETPGSIFFSSEEHLRKNKKVYLEFIKLRNGYRDRTLRINSLESKIRRISKI